MSPEGRLLVGTSGWSYEDWVGPVYPRALAKRPGSFLDHYARLFRTVEINSTFYAIPAPRVVAGWIARARRFPGFEFSAKAPQDATHRAMVRGDDAEAARVLSEFAEVVARPLAEAGLLGAVLLQLAPRFDRNAAHLRALAAAIDLVRATAPEVAVEFRHGSWVDGRRLAGDAADLLRERNAAACAVDGPPFPDVWERTAAHAYVRFHGRREEAWQPGFRGGASARYDYLYSEAELRPWVARIAAETPRHERVRAYFNNHPAGKAVANAREVAALAGAEPPAPPLPPRAERPRGQAPLEAFDADALRRD